MITIHQLHHLKGNLYNVRMIELMSKEHMSGVMALNISSMVIDSKIIYLNITVDKR